MTYCKSGTRRLTALGLALILSGTGASALAAASTVSKKEAATIAKQAYPGKVVGEKLTKRDNGSSVYMVKIKGSQGTQTVAVNANTGSIAGGGALSQPPGGGMPSGPAGGGGGYTP